MDGPRGRTWFRRAWGTTRGVADPCDSRDADGPCVGRRQVRHGGRQQASRPECLRRPGAGEESPPVQPGVQPGGAAGGAAGVGGSLPRSPAPESPGAGTDLGPAFESSLALRSEAPGGRLVCPRRTLAFDGVATLPSLVDRLPRSIQGQSGSARWTPSVTVSRGTPGGLAGAVMPEPLSTAASLHPVGSPVRPRVWVLRHPAAAFAGWMLSSCGCST